MSNVIDERIVSMEFDNSNFEKNVAESMSTLDKLKEKLKFSNSGKELTKIGEAADKLDFSKTSSAVEAVGQKFSALETIAIGALLRIGQKAEDAAERLVKSLSLDQITAGFNKFEQKTTSAATLIAQGFDVSEVNEQLEKLNWYTDETSYNFVDMVSNIGKFTASGRGLSESVTAMEGIANWAALSGQNATKASMAMYQLSQAMSKGALKYDDWKSIQNASMDTKEFRTQALAAAEQLGTVKKVGEDAFQVVGEKAKKGAKLVAHSMNEMFTSDMLTKQAWLSSDVMMKTFSNYASAVDDVSAAMDKLNDNNEGVELLTVQVIKAYEALQKGGSEFERYAKDELHLSNEMTDSLRETVSQFDEFGVKAFSAAQKARTWTDAIEATKDAVSTGWMKTFELLIGDSEEATEVFSDLTEGMWTLFASGVSARNKLLGEWKELGGRDDLIAGLGNIWNGFIDIIEALREAWANVFPPMTAERLKSLTERFKEFTERIRPSTEQLDKLKTVVTKILTPLRYIWVIFKALVMTAKSVISIAVKLVAIVVKLVVNLGLLRKALNLLQMIARGILTVIVALANGLVYLFKTIKDSVVVQKVIEGLGKAFGVLKEVATDTIEFIVGGFKALTGQISKSDFSNILDKIKTKLIGVYNYLIKIPIIGTLIKGLTTVIGGAFVIIQKVITTIKDFFLAFMENPQEAIQSVTDKLKEFGETLAEWYDGSALQKAVNVFKDVFKKIKEVSAQFIGDLIDMFKNMDLTTVITLGIGAGLTFLFFTLGKMFKQIGGLASGLSSTVKTINKIIKGSLGGDQIANKILTIAAAFAVLAGSLFLLSKVEPGKLAATAGIVVGMITLIAAVALAFGKFADSFKKDTFKQIPNLGKTLLEVAASLAVVAVAFRIMNGIDGDDIAKYMTALIGIVVAMGTFCIAVSKWGKKLELGVGSMLGLSVSVLIMSKALQNIAKIGDAGLIEEAAWALVPIMGAMALLAAGAGKVKFSGAVGLIALCLFLKAFLPVLQELHIGEVAKSLGSQFAQHADMILGAIIALAALALGIKLVTSRIAKINATKPVQQMSKFLQVALSLAAIGAALYLLVEAYRKVSDLTFTLEGTIKTLGLLTVAIGLLIGITMIAKSVTNTTEILKITGSLLIMVGAVHLMVEMCKACQGLKFADLEGGIVAMITCSVLLAILMKSADGVEKSKVLSILAMVTAIGILMAELAIISNIPLTPQRITALLVTAAAMTGVIFAFSKVLKGAHFGEKAQTAPIIALVAGVGLILGSIIALMAMIGQSENPVMALVSLGVIAGVLSGTMLALAGTFKLIAKTTASKSQNFMPALLTMLATLGIICTTFIALAALKVDWLQMLSYAAGISGTLIAFSYAMKLANGATKGISLTSVIELVSTFLIITASFALLSALNIDGARMLDYAVALSGTIIALAAACKLADGSLAGAASIAILAGSMVVAAAAFALMTQLCDFNNLLASGIALGLAIAALTVAANMANGAVLGAASVAILAGSMLVAALSLAILATLPMEGVITAAIALAGTIAILAVVSTMATAAIVGAASVAVLCASMVIAAIAIAILATLPMEGVLTGALALAGTIAILVVVSTLATAALVGAASVVVLCASMVLAAMAIAMLATLPMGATWNAVGELLAITTVLTLIAYLATGAIIGAAALVVLGLAVIAFASGISTLSYANWSALQNATTILPVLALGLLAFGVSCLAAVPGVVSFTATLTAFVAVMSILSVAIPIITLFSDAICNMTIAITKGLNEATSIIAGFKQAFINSAIDAAKGLNIGFKKAVPAAKEAGYKLGKAVEDGYREGFRWHSPPEPVPESFEDAGKEAIRQGNKQSSNFYNAGGDLGASLTDGFDKGFDTDAILGSIKGLGSDAGGSQSQSIFSDSGSLLGMSFGDGLSKGMEISKSLFGDDIADITNTWNNLEFEPKTAEVNINVTTTYNTQGHGSLDDFAYQVEQELSSAQRKFDEAKKMYDFYQIDANMSDRDNKDNWNRKKAEADATLRSTSDGLIKATANANKAKASLDGMKKTVEDLGGATEDTNNDLANLSDGLGGAGSAAKKAQTPFEKLKETIAGQIDIFSEFNTKTELTADKLLANMQSQVAGVSSWATKMAVLGTKGIEQGLLDKLAELGPQGYEYVNAFSQMTAEQLAQANQLWGASLALPGLAADMLTGGNQLGTNIVTGLANGMGNGTLAYAAAIGLGQTTLDELANTLEIHSPSQATYRDGQYLVQGLSLGIEAWQHEPKNKLIILSTSLLNELRQRLSVSKFSEIGKYIPLGVAAGIRANASEAINAAVEMAVSTYKAAKEALVIESPSHLFRDGVGKFIPLGMAKGIDDNAYTVIDSIQSLADSTIQPLKDTIAKISESFDEEVSTEPVIRPVLDLTNIQNGAKQISAIMSTNQAVKASTGFTALRNQATADSKADDTTIAGNKSITFVQNNYSPEALSRIDIYRQTKNQLSAAKGLVNA